MKHKKLIIALLFFNIIGFIFWQAIKSNSTENNNHLTRPQETTFLLPRGEMHGTLLSCTERTSVFFLKTHKCGSSTVQNVLMRFGQSHQLNFVLPEKDNYIGNPEMFSPSMIGPKLTLDVGERYDIFTHHTRYEYSAIRRVMKENAPFVTIMRDPVDLQLSLYNYYHLNVLYNASLADLLHAGHRELLQMPRVWHKFGWNQMAWDLGVSIQNIHSPRTIKWLITKVEAEFHLVMITEFMEASLVLLADLMCWSLEEVRFLRLNVGIPKVGDMNKQIQSILSEKERYILEELNVIDVNIYNHFKKRFKDHILQYGVDRMFSQVKRLLALNSKLFSDCTLGLTASQDKQFSVLKYVLKPNASPVCREVVRDELEYTRELQREQESRIKKNISIVRLLPQTAN